MKKQYKNPFENPNAKLWDKKVKDYKFSERKETSLGNKIPDLEGYIYVPKIKLYVAKEKTLHGKNWYEAHKELHEQGLQMLTIRQFIDFILCLEQSPLPDAKKILDEILDEKKSWREEWLDAKFTEKAGLPIYYRGRTSIRSLAPFIKDISGNFGDVSGGGGWSRSTNGPTKKAGELYIHYNHRIENGKLVAQNYNYNYRIENGNLVAKNIEPLEECLMKGYSVDLKSCNKQGLPTKEGNDINYFPPEEGRVARFYVGFNILPCLNCSGYPKGGSLRLGVRAARKK